jgi:membrane protein
MEWSTRLPVIGPWIARAMRTHGWRAFEHAQKVYWDRLAAAVTFASFIAMFPLITLGAAVGAAVLDPQQQRALVHKLDEQLPGLAGKVDVAGLATNAATVGVIAAVLRRFTGIGWIAQLRGCLRAVWDLEADDGNPLRRKALDAGVLAGLGGLGLASLACSAFATSAAHWAVDRLGMSHSGPGGVLLTAAGTAAALVTDFALLAYVLTLLPGVRPGRRAVVQAGLIGAVGFELLKALLSGYLQGVAAKSMYGAFGTPVALLLWINFMAKLLMLCASWTATADRPQEEPLPAPAAAPGTAAGPAVSPAGGPPSGWATAGVPAVTRRRARPASRP